MNFVKELVNPIKKVNFLDFDRKGLTAFFVGLGEKPFRATQLMKWIYHENVYDFDAMSNLSKSLRAYLTENCVIATPEIAVEQIASDGTIKWAMQTHCGNRIESVFIPEEGRNTLCISSQIGCALACTFCSTAQQGFNRNLATSEIIGQLFVAQNRVGKDNRITNVVMMGMGEPLQNYDQVLPALRTMLHDHGYGPVSYTHLTLPTKA